MKNLWKFLRSKALFCYSISMIPKPPSILGLQNFQATLGGVFALISDPLQRQCFLYLESQSAHKESWEGGKDCICHLEPSSLVQERREASQPFFTPIDNWKKVLNPWPRNVQGQTKVSKWKTTFRAPKDPCQNFHPSIRNIDGHHH